MYKTGRLKFTYPNPGRISVLWKDFVHLQSKFEKTANRRGLGGMHHNGMMPGSGYHGGCGYW